MLASVGLGSQPASQLAGATLERFWIEQNDTPHIDQIEERSPRCTRLERQQGW